MRRFLRLGVVSVVPAGLLIWAASAAWLARWTSDDAFISFRYARNLVEGHGLVFNVGERVEGFTNLLWTLWSAAGLYLGANVERWAAGWSLAAYLACVGLLWANHRRLAPRGSAGAALPLAAAGAALHPDWNAWATGGLETTPFTLLLLAAFVVVSLGPTRAGAALGGGALAALAALTRPDGLLPALLLGLLLLRWDRGRPRRALAFALAFVAIWLPFTLWRVGYYGEFLPNTYYAKSAYRSWYGQGWHYVWLYLQRYWVFAAAPLLLLLVPAGPRRSTAVVHGESTQLFRRQLEGAAVVTVGYVLFVIRVGGDFMFARLLIPVTPFLLLLLELGCLKLFRFRRAAGWSVALLALVALRLTPSPVDGSDWSRGVADERAYYSTERVAELEHWADVLAGYFEGLDARVAFYGDEARLVYRARFPVAIESHSGLTDRFVARLKIDQRGRPGHEKPAPLDYLIERRRVHFTFSKVPQRALRRLIPEVVVRFGEDVYGQVLHWDPALIAALRARGADVPDFEVNLDRTIGALDRMPTDQVARIYERLQVFYFDPVDDPAREAAFLRRLGEERRAPVR